LEFPFLFNFQLSFCVFLFRENGSGKVLKPMDSEQLREYGHLMVDFIADYYKTIEDFPVLSQVQPGYLHKLLPDSAPDHPETLDQVLDDVRAKILPGVTHWQSPSFFAYYPSNSSVAGFLGEMLSAGLGIVGFSWVTSPAATELEMIVLDWVAKLLNLPEQFMSKGNGGGVIQGSASEAVLVVLIAARDKVLRSVGKNALEKLVVYSSDQTHSALQKACQIAGIHPENCRVLTTDSSTNYALRPESLQEAVSRDLEAGLIPFFLCANVGTTSSTAVDPLAALGKIANSNGIWFHVDAAYAGSACICPEYRQYIDGVETADSFNMNAHKWFLTNFDCSLLWVKDQDSLTLALSTNPEFLKNKASQANLVVDYKDWQIPLGRRFRSLKLWMVLRLYGSETLKSYIRNHIKLAKEFEQLVSQDPNFEIVTPRIFALVCFRLVPVKDEEKKCNNRNRELLDAVNSSGKLFMSHTALSGKIVLRCAIGAPLTEEKHVKEAWKIIQEEASYLLHK
jgi:tyrosine decarboxylase